MLPEMDKYKAKSSEKGPIRKMVLVAKDYVHYLRRYIKVVADGKDLDGVIKPGDADLKETPKCSQLLASLRDDLRCATAV
ncbi:hypothetical protein JTE90_013650 [Oedothorax gibbosus]|uniref:Uncharacterized protein n=1 Tax=Oedothorax gibbosus TaxID=931172 RepID=A0AAV6TVC4_9ARAC|nr:hypothetical protein JTE90_013650 [Oedothorax gibbosus]